MAKLTVQQIVEDGVQPNPVAAEAGGDTFVNDSSNRTFLLVDNQDASGKTVTITAVDGEKMDHALGKLTKADGGGSVPAGEQRLFGPIYFAAYGANPEISYDDVTSLSVTPIKL